MSLIGYTPRVASRHPRIQVPGDPELRHAITRGRELLGPRVPTSQVVRELALRGVAALEEDNEAAAAARDFLVSVADGASILDLERLRSARDRAWR